LQPNYHASKHSINNLDIEAAVEREFQQHPQFKTYPQRPVFFHLGDRPIYFWEGRSTQKAVNANAASSRQLSKQEYRHRQALLSQMGTEVESRLAQSLHHAVLLNLGKEQQPHQVQRPWDISVKVGEQRSFQLPSETSILEVFENAAMSGKFLILGKPGGGKTTTLLELAQALVERAETDSDAPIPVILELSAWQTVTKGWLNKEKYDPSIKEWILSQLRSKGVSQEIGNQWIREKELVLLLDGLDELPSERQAKCVRAINEFLDSEFSPLHLVVCSRKEEYENYEEVLHLNGAICVEDLTVEQMRHYFVSVNLEDFWESIKDSEKIVNFIRQPLFLAITSIAYQQIDVEEWINCNTEQRAIDYLLGIFRVLAVSQGTRSTVILSDVQGKNSLTNRNLIWLAKYLEISRQSDFVVHKIQPYLLLEGLDCYQTITSFISRLVFCFWMYIVIDFPTGLSFFKNFSWSNFLNSIISSLQNFYFSWSIFFKVIFSIFTRFFKVIFSSEFFLLLILFILIYLVAFVLHQILFNRMNENYRHITINEFNLLRIDSFYLFFKELFYRFYCCLAIISIIYLFFGLFDLPGAILDGSFIKSILDGSLFFTLSKFVMFPSIICAPALAIFYASTGKLTTDKEKINPTTNYLSLILNVLFLTTFGFFYYTIVSQIFPLVSWHIVLMASVYIGIFLGGGYEIFKYFILRLILFKFRYMPWNITRFLDYCTERLILQRVGNRYRFIHRLVQEHFANLEIQKK
jgi:DNA polymerase III delta prime subunit